MHVSLAKKWHRDAGTGTSVMDADEENGIAMEVQVRMLQDGETCIRTCSARHAVGLRVVGRGRQVLAGRAVHARGRQKWRCCVLPGPALDAVRLSVARRVLACAQTVAHQRWSAQATARCKYRDRSGPSPYRRGSLCMSPWQRKWTRQVRTGPPRTRSQSTSRLLSLQTARSPVSEGEQTPLI